MSIRDGINSVEFRYDDDTKTLACEEILASGSVNDIYIDPIVTSEFAVLEVQDEYGEVLSYCTLTNGKGKLRLDTNAVIKRVNSLPLGSCVVWNTLLRSAAVGESNQGNVAVGQINVVVANTGQSTKDSGSQVVSYLGPRGFRGIGIKKIIEEKIADVNTTTGRTTHKITIKTAYEEAKEDPKSGQEADETIFYILDGARGYGIDRIEELKKEQVESLNEKWMDGYTHIGIFWVQDAENGVQTTEAHKIIYLPIPEDGKPGADGKDGLSVEVLSPEYVYDTDGKTVLGVNVTIRYYTDHEGNYEDETYFLPAGPKGDQGDRGPQGEIGPRGETGSKGEDGDSCMVYVDDEKEWQRTKITVDWESPSAGTGGESHDYIDWALKVVNTMDDLQAHRDAQVLSERCLYYVAEDKVLLRWDNAAKEFRNLKIGTPVKLVNYPTEIDENIQDGIAKEGDLYVSLSNDKDGGVCGRIYYIAPINDGTLKKFPVGGYGATGDEHSNIWLNSSWGGFVPVVDDNGSYTESIVMGNLSYGVFPSGAGQSLVWVSPLIQSRQELEKISGHIPFNEFSVFVYEDNEEHNTSLDEHIVINGCSLPWFYDYRVRDVQLGKQSWTDADYLDVYGRELTRVMIRNDSEKHSSELLIDVYRKDLYRDGYDRLPPREGETVLYLHYEDGVTPHESISFEGYDFITPNGNWDALIPEAGTNVYHISAVAENTYLITRTKVEGVSDA